MQEYEWKSSGRGRIERTFVLFPYSPVIDVKCVEPTDSNRLAAVPDGHICAKCAEATENTWFESNRTENLIGRGRDEQDIGETRNFRVTVLQINRFVK